MWIARFKVWHDSILAQFTKGLDVSAVVYYLNFFKKGNKYYHNKIAVFSGPDWKKAVRNVAKDFTGELLEVDENKCFFRIPESKAFHSIVLSSEVFLTQPILFKDGCQYWEVASNDKKAIQKVYNAVKRFKGGAEIIYLKKVKHLAFAAEPVLEKLSDKQRGAVMLAFQNGYYVIPRKKTLEEIAKNARIPYSTLRERLQRAESAIITSLAQG
ncbi:MAG: helix-turn-helix domain-containing protein [Candidatus Micrarchaeota archaeon]